MFFTYSFLFGLGDSFIFMASFLITAKNFRKYQSLAVGVVSVGGSVGVLVMGPFLQFLLDTVGWRGTYRVASALLCLVTVCGAAYGEPVEDEYKNTTRAGLLQPESSEYPCTEAASSSVEVVKSVNSNDLKTESFSKLANKSNNAKEGIGTCNLSKPCASRREIFASNGEERTLISVTYTDDADISDMKVGKKKETGKLMDFSVFKVPSFTIVVISLTLMSLGHYTPQLHLVSNHVIIISSLSSAVASVPPAPAPGASVVFAYQRAWED